MVEKEKKQRKELKLKEQEFVDKLIENDGNRTKTAREVFGITDPKYAHVKAERLLQKPEVVLAVEEKKLSLREALEKRGITGEKIAEKVGLLLDAKKGARPDYTAIDKGLSHATRIHGIDEEGSNKQPSTTYNFIFSGDVREKVRVIDAEIKNLLTAKPDDKKD